MPTLNPSRFSVHSNVEMPADQYEVQVEDSAAYLAGSESDRVTLSSGLLTVADDPVEKTIIESGRIDEYELIIVPDSLEGRLRGRDQMADILDTWVRRRFVREVSSAPTATPVMIPVGSAVVLTDPEVAAASLAALTPESVGTWTARSIAEAIASEVGLMLVWECDDYELQTEFSAVGRAIDLLRQLVEPFSQVDRFPVDIVSEGSTVIVTQRRPSLAVPDFVFDAYDARILSFLIRKRRPVWYGFVTLTGAATPSAPLTVDENGDVLPGPLRRLVDVQRHYFPGTDLLTGLIETITFEDDVGVRRTERREYSSTVVQYIDSFGQPQTKKSPLELMGETITKYFYTVRPRVSLDGTVGNVTTAPVIDREETIVSAKVMGPFAVSYVRFDELAETPTEQQLGEQPKFEEVRQEVKLCAYDKTGFQKAVRTERKVRKEVQTQFFTSETRWITESVDEETWKVITPLVTKHTRKTEQAVAGTGKMVVVDTQEQELAGYPPFGPGRVMPFTSPSPNAPTPGHPVTVAGFVSTDPRGKTVSYGNEQLVPAVLLRIFDQFKSAHGLWETEMLIRTVGMPFVRRGSVLRIMGVEDADGVPIPTQPALVYNVRFLHDEASDTASVISEIRAVYWSVS